MKKNKPSFLDYISLLVSWRKRIIINFFIICCIALCVSLIVPKWYKAYTTILPPVDEGMDLGLSSLVKNLPVGNLGFGMGMISEEASRFVAIINSRTLMNATVNRFKLNDVYKKDNIEEAVKELRKHVALDLNDDGTITLYCEARTSYLSFKEKDNPARVLAKEMANFYIEKYDEVNKRLKTEKAKNARIFIEKRYFQNLNDIKAAEIAYKEFQEKYGTIALPEQTTATINTAAELEAEIIAKEIQRDVLSQFVGENHSEFDKIKVELRMLKEQYGNLKFNSENKLGGNNQDNIILPLSIIPELGVMYARLYRELTIQNALLEFLLPQYESAKIQEQRDTPTVQVLDFAVDPILKDRPKRAWIIILSGLFVIVCYIIACYIIVNIQYMKQAEPDRLEKIEKLLRDLRPSQWFR